MRRNPLFSEDEKRLGEVSWLKKGTDGSERIGKWSRSFFQTPRCLWNSRYERGEGQQGNHRVVACLWYLWDSSLEMKSRKELIQSKRSCGLFLKNYHWSICLLVFFITGAFHLFISIQFWRMSYFFIICSYLIFYFLSLMFILFVNYLCLMFIFLLFRSIIHIICLFVFIM